MVWNDVALRRLIISWSNTIRKGAPMLTDHWCNREGAVAVARSLWATVPFPHYRDR